jgi:hypothetical protein
MFDRIRFRHFIIWYAVLFHMLIHTPQIEDLQQLVVEVMILVSQWLLLLNLFFKESIPKVSSYSCCEKEKCSDIDSRLLFVLYLSLNCFLSCILIPCIWKWFAQGRVSQKLSSRGEYVSMKIGPIRVDMMKYFLWWVTCTICISIVVKFIIFMWTYSCCQVTMCVYHIKSICHI